MKKQIIKVAVALLFLLTMVGVASAAANQQTVGTSQNPQQIGTIVAQDAINPSSGLGMNSSDSNLLITTASTAHQNGQTTEDSVQAVVDTTNTLSTDTQKITYGQGNLLIINNPNGPLEFTFISKTGTTLMAKKYSVSETGVITTTKDAYNIGTAQSEEQFQTAIAALGTNGYDIATIANLWAQGAPADLLITTFSTGTVTAETISSYAEAKSFALKFTTPGTDNVNNYVITNAGEMDDDIGFYGIFGYSFSSTNSGTPGETVFINYITSNGLRSGNLVLMKINDLTSQFTAEKGIPVVAGTLSEIQYNYWLLNKLETDPSALFTVLAYKNVNETDIAYLWYDSSVGYGHGIDEKYITGLTDVSGGWTAINNVIPITDYNKMFNLGVDVFNAAYSTGLFTAEDLLEGNVAVVLPPYDADYLGTYSLVGFTDGVVSAAQTLLTNAHLNAAGFTINNILSLRRGPLWRGSSIQTFFAVVDHSNTAHNHDIDNLIISSVKVFSTYNTTTNQFSVATTSAIQDISPLVVTAVPSNWFATSDIAGTIYAWAGGAPYNYINSLLMVGCISPESKEYDIATNLLSRYALGQNEHYLVIAFPSSGVCTRTTLYGVSPSTGTYYASWIPSSTSYYSGILIIWNDVTNTGKAMLVYYNSTTISNAETSDGYTTYTTSYNDLFWHLDHAWNNGDEANVVASAITVVKTVMIGPEFLNYLTAAGGDTIQKILDYVEPVTPVTPPQGTSITPSQGNSGNGFTAITGTVINAWNGLTSGISNTTNEIAPGLPLEQNTASTETSSPANVASETTNLPIGIIIGTIFLAIAAILVYLGRNTIIATLTGQGRPGK